MIRLSDPQKLIDIVGASDAVIMAGIPGSGKTTVAKTLGSELCSRPHGCLVGYRFSTDDLRIVNGEYVYRPEETAQKHEANLKHYVEALRTKNKECSWICCDNTNTEIHHISPYVATAAAYGWHPVVVVLDASLEIAQRNTHGVGPMACRRFRKQLHRLITTGIPKYWDSYLIEVK